MQLTVREVSHLLNVPEETVYRWIQRGTLPAYRVQDQYRFNRAELLEWATLHQIEVSPALFPKPESPSTPLPRLARALEQGGIHHGLAGDDKEAVLRAVTQVMPLPAGMDRDLLLQVLLAREELASTGVGEGIAIPHVRHPIVLEVPTSAISLCFLETPVDFSALDGQPVHCLFTLVSPTVRAHLHLLSRLAFALRDPGFKAAVLRHGAPAQILEEARRVESQLAPARPGENGAR